MKCLISNSTASQYPDVEKMEETGEAETIEEKTDDGEEIVEKTAEVVISYWFMAPFGINGVLDDIVIR